MNLTTPSPLSNVVFMLAPSPTSNVVGFTKLSQWRWQSNFGLGGGADRLPTTLARVEGAQVVFNVAYFIVPVLFRPVLSKFQVFFCGVVRWYRSVSDLRGQQLLPHSFYPQRPNPHEKWSQKNKSELSRMRWDTVPQTLTKFPSMFSCQCLIPVMLLLNVPRASAFRWYT